MRQQTKRMGALVIGLVCATGVWPAQGEGKPEPTTTTATMPKADPEADKVLRAMVQTYQKAKTFRGEVVWSVKITAEGMNQEMTGVYQLAVRRPNQVSIRLKEGMPMVVSRVLCDGSKLFTWGPGQAKYTEKAAPSLKDGKALGLSYPAAGLVGPLLLSPEPYVAAFEGIQQIRYAGQELLEGRTCHRLTMTATKLGADVWIDAGDKPLLRTVCFDFHGAAANMQGPAGKMKSMTTTISYRSCELDPDIPPETFRFVPEPGDEKAEAGGAAGQSPLVGKQAPPLKLALLGGGELDLAEHKGKNVVVLDFWATWCGPCRRSLPIVAEVTSACADRGVAFYAVNLRETPEQASQFLADQRLKLAVALDSEGKAAEAYGADAIPMTVIIGKDGNVKAVHVGMDGDLKQTLTRELNDQVGPSP